MWAYLLFLLQVVTLSIRKILLFWRSVLMFTLAATLQPLSPNSSKVSEKRVHCMDHINTLSSLSSSSVSPPIRSRWSGGPFGYHSRLQQHSNSLSGQLTHSSVWTSQLLCFFCWQRWREWDGCQPLALGYSTNWDKTHYSSSSDADFCIIDCCNCSKKTLKVDFYVRVTEINEQKQNLCNKFILTPSVPEEPGASLTVFSSAAESIAFQKIM